MRSILARDDSRRLLNQAAIAHFGMVTKRGPHVTPELFAWTAGRFWFATARRTLKARTLSPGDRVGLLLMSGNDRLIISGEARPLDGVRPLTLAASPQESALYPAGFAAFVIRNASHLAGFIAQGPRAFPRSLTAFRMFIAVRPVAAVLIKDDRIVDSAGPWIEGIEGIEGIEEGRVEIDPVPFVSPAVPEDLADIAESYAADAAVAVETAMGPVVLPASWDPDDSTVLIATELLERVGAKEGEVAVEVDRMVGFAMEDKKGVLLRGDMELVQRGRFTRIEIDPNRMTSWRGMETETMRTPSGGRRG